MAAARRRAMTLTPDLVACVARVVEDAGPSPGAVYLTDEDYDEIVRSMLAKAPTGDLWVFGSPRSLSPKVVRRRSGDGIVRSASKSHDFAAHVSLMAS
jgi:cation transport protein ChaC